jgi:type IV pilus assembly protein PilM
MAETKSAWGIEIGQAGLKAIKLRFADAANQVMAVAFDYVAHPKLLNQPDAVPDELIRQALDTFLSRNAIGSDLVAISLPGQNALAKFIQLPPVEQSKVAEIVKYEARQQIPFALEEVIWDYQALGGGVEESGYLLDGEVGLFAMKREQVQHHLQPFIERKVEVELIQIAPLALYNFLCYDRLGYRKSEPREPNDEYSVVVDMGSDATTLIVTNGKKIWIRNMPVGGNHFTRALTKDMKLTFAKAEHLKCNATKSPDPRAVFQSLRPVFNDYVAEIQRSIGFFSSVNRNAKISRLIGVGNGFRLAGLQKFLQQNLQYDVERVDTFQAVVGDSVLNAPLFQENLLTFCVPYGLALQCLKLTDIHTSLLPPEIVTGRIIRRKKPWAAATAATLLLGLATSAAGFGTVSEYVNTKNFGTAESEVKEIDKRAKDLAAGYKKAQGENDKWRESGAALITSLDSREYWLEIYKAIEACLPRPIGEQKDVSDPSQIERISIRSITTQKFDDLGAWFKDKAISGEGTAKTYLRDDKDDRAKAAAEAKEAGNAAADAAAKPPASAAPALPLEYEISDRTTGPTGPGYVFFLSGVHYHNEKPGEKKKNGPEALMNRGIGYLDSRFVKKLQQWEQVQESPSGGESVHTPVRLIGITHATILEFDEDDVDYIPDRDPATIPVMAAPAAGGRPGRRGNNPAAGIEPRLPAIGQPANKENAVQLTRSKFRVVFAWSPTPREKRKAWPPPATGAAAPAEAAPKK